MQVREPGSPAKEIAARRPARRAAILFLVLFLLARATRAEVALPVDLQAALLVKISWYDRNFRDRAGDRVRILVVTKQGHAESRRVGAQFQRAMEKFSTIAGLPKHISVMNFESVEQVRDATGPSKASVVYFAPGLDAEIESLAAALAGRSVLSVGAVASYAARGVVVAFDEVSSRPRVLVHLANARAQSVAFAPAFLQLAQVIR